MVFFVIALCIVALYFSFKHDSNDHEVRLNIDALDFFEEYIRRHPEASDEEIEEVRKMLF